MTSSCPDKLKRRPIHKGHLEENQRENKKIYPKLPDEDELELSEEEYDENELNYRDQERNDVELQNWKESYKKAKRIPKQNDKAEIKTKKLSNSTNATLTPFYDIFSSYYKYFLIMLFIISMLLISLLYPSTSNKSVTEISLKEKLKDMQDLFDNQNHLTFRILENALNKVVNVTEKPSAPAIITVTVNKNARYKSHKFSHHLADVLAPQNTILINESVSGEIYPDDIKLKIDNKIQSIAKKKSLFVVIVDNLQNIPLKSAMVFHNFCDHEAAPFKEAVFLFIVPLNDILSTQTPSKMIDKAAFQQLKNIWNKATPDEIDSLIARITVNVINIT